MRGCIDGKGHVTSVVRWPGFEDRVSSLCRKCGNLVERG